MPNAFHSGFCRRATWLGLVLSLIVISVATGAAQALASPATYDGISADGKIAVFSTKEQMVPGDTDQEEDVYLRSFDTDLGEYVTRQVSVGPKGGNDTLPSHYDGISADGMEVFFSTREQMVPGDSDHKEDVYVRDVEENRTILVSQGDAGCAAQNCGNGEADSSFLPDGVPAAGGRVFFATTEKLTSADSDSSFDVYRRDVASQKTVLVSAGDPSCSSGGCGNGSQGVLFRGTDEAGSKAFFTTGESLNAADTDSEADIYARDIGAGTTSLVSVAGVCPSGLQPGQNCEPSYGGASPDGSHVFFETNEQLLGGDTDTSQDVYDWSGSGTPTLVSTGPDGGNGAFNVTYAGASGDGAVVYFQTGERLDVAADTDSTQDVYQHTAGATTLVSAGVGGKGNEAIPADFNWASSGGGPPVVLFSTRESMTGEDTDSAQDVYERSGGVTTLVSVDPEGGAGELDASFAGASADGSKVFFVSSESLLAADTDSSSDIYLRSTAGTVLVSVGQIGGNGAFAAGLHGVSDDGTRAFFVTQERLSVDDDFSGEADVYGWSGSGTLLVSVKNSPDLILGPPPPSLERTSPTSPNPSTTPAIVGQAAPGALVKVYSTFDCSGEPAAQGTAAALASPGLTVTVPVALGSTTSYRATAEAEGIVSVCSSLISYKQEAAAPPPEEGTGVTGGTGGGSGTAGGGTGTSGGGKVKGPVEFAYVAPQARITFGPLAKTRKHRPTFRFFDTTGQPGTRFFCRIDKMRWQGCSSPIKVKPLAFGRHVFAVKAVNAIGVAGNSTVKRDFKVVRP